MKRFLVTLSALVSLSTAAAAEEFCQFTSTPRVFLSGEIHGTEPAQEMSDLMIQSALRKNIYLGLEIDPVALANKLRPENRDAMFGTEEDFSKGFGIVYWSWWLSQTRWLMPALTRTDLPEAISSFHYFLLTNSEMQKAWASAKSDETITKPAFPGISQIVNVLDQNLADKLPPDQAGLLIPLDSENNLAATATVLKAVLRAFVNIGLAETPAVAPKYIPEELSRMNELLNYPKFEKGGKDYYIHLKTFYDLSKRFKQLFVLDWRSEQMARATLRHLCMQEAKGLPNVPTVVIVGGDHLVRMQDFLKENGVEASLDMQGASQTGDFEKLINQLKAEIPLP